MRIAFIRQHYRPDGGGERFLARLAQKLLDANHHVHLITRQWPQQNGGPFHVHRCDPFSMTRIGRQQRFADTVQYHYPEGSFDLIQSHERIPGYSLYRAGDGVHAEFLAQRMQTATRLERFALQHSRYHRYVLNTEEALFTHPKLKHVICNSHWVKTQIQQRFGLNETMFSVIYNGVDTDYFHPSCRQHRVSIRQQLGIPEDTPCALFVGSGFARKGLAAALKVIAQSAVPWHMIVVGRDKKQSDYVRLAEQLHLSKRVHFVGVQTDVRPYYGAADVLVLPTQYDPFPNVIWEAMACGLTILTSPYCGAAELIEQGRQGYVFEPSNTLEGAEKLDACVENQPPDTFNRHARNLAERSCIDTAVSNFTALYQRLIT